MIFEKTDIFMAMNEKERLRHFGSFSKKACAHNRHRSNMMVNPLNLKHMNRIDEMDADVLTLNLEDAIAPSRKKEALINIGLFLSNMKHSSSAIVVRINPLDEGGREEISFLNDLSFDAVRISKVKKASEIEETARLLSRDKEIHISMETAEAFRDLSRWGDIDERFTTANLGILDLLADLNIPQTILNIGNDTIAHILSSFLVDASIASIHPVSFMFQDYKDTESFRSWCIYEKSLGYRSKACMGPAQTEIANDIFGVDEIELKRAREIKEAFEASSAKGINGFMHEKYGFIDEPIYKDALNILESDGTGKE